MGLPTRIARGLAATVAILVCSAVPASALPPGGAGSDTPGTSASVSPKSLAAGAVIRFTISGFPAGETVYIKIDDGSSCSVDAAQGACVYHSQKLNSRGSASGSFTLPADLAPGPHWLRFLASKEILDSEGAFQGTEGYTRRGGADFAVVAPKSSSKGDGDAGDDGSQGSDRPETTAPVAAAPGETTGSGTSSVTGRGGVVVIEATPEPTPTPAASTPAPVNESESPEDAQVAAASASSSTSFPLVGVVGFAVMLVGACGVVGWSVRRASSPG
ncbi:MAG: hypothetical protein ABWX74_19335 [Aeromicrobium sp.]